MVSSEYGARAPTVTRSVAALVNRTREAVPHESANARWPRLLGNPILVSETSEWARSPGQCCRRERGREEG